MPVHTFRHFELLAKLTVNPASRTDLAKDLECDDHDLQNSITKVRDMGIQLICRKGTVALHPESKDRAEAMATAYVERNGD